jgi:hypothetical protein
MSYIKLYEQWLVEEETAQPAAQAQPAQATTPQVQAPATPAQPAAPAQASYTIKVTPSGLTETPFEVTGTSEQEYTNASANTFAVTTGNGSIPVDSQIMISPVGDASGKMDVAVGNTNDPASMKTYKSATVEVTKKA